MSRSGPVSAAGCYLMGSSSLSGGVSGALKVGKS